MDVINWNDPANAGVGNLLGFIIMIAFAIYVVNSIFEMYREGCLKFMGKLAAFGIVSIATAILGIENGFGLWLSLLAGFAVLQVGFMVIGDPK